MNTMVVPDELLISSIVDAQPESVIWLRPVFGADENEIIDFEVCYLNHVTTTFLQAPKELIIGKRLLQTDLLNEQIKQLVFQKCMKVWETGAQQQFTFFSNRLNSYFNVLKTKVLDGILSVTRDFTFEVRAEQKLKHQADLLNSILDASINGVFACEAIRNNEGKIVDLSFLKFNKMFLELTNKQEKDLEGNTYLNCFPTAKETFELNCSVIETGEPIRKEVFVGGDGIHAWYDISIAQLGDNGVVVTFTDITENKKNKEAITAQAEKLQNVIDSTQTGITVIVPVYNKKEIVDFRYKVINETFSRYLGLSPDKMINRLLSDMFPSYKSQGTFDRYKTIFLNGQPQRFDLHYVKDGLDVWVDVLAKKVGDEIVVTFHDYTPLKKAQLQLETMVKDLKRSNMNLEDFAYAASHDLQEPLRKIHFFADKLKRLYSDKFDEEGISMFERMEAASQRMRNLIDDLLVYSQINLKPKEDEHIDLNEIMHDVISDLETIIQEKNAHITTDKLPIMKGDKPQLRQLFQNLISNSLKYSFPDRVPFISVRSRQVQGKDVEFSIPHHLDNHFYYRVEFSDNGIGFDQDDAEKIFNVFQRLHGKTEYSGTGVGLAIVKKVVDNHNGFITACSKKSEGSTFTILLPAIISEEL